MEAWTQGNMTSAETYAYKRDQGTKPRGIRERSDPLVGSQGKAFSVAKRSVTRDSDCVNITSKILLHVN